MMTVEFAKQLRRVRTYVGFAVCLGIPIITALAIDLAHPSPARERRVDVLAAIKTSGINVGLVVLSSATGLLLPVIVSLFVGESVAGEARWGSLRYLLVRPISRMRLLAAKLTVGTSLSFAACIVVTLTGLVVGVALLGWHPVSSAGVERFASGSSPAGVAKSLGVTFSQWSAVGRLALSTLYVFWSMGGVIGFAFFLSVATDSTFGSVAGGAGLYIVSLIIDALPGTQSFRPYLPTHYLQAWNALFVSPVPTHDLVRGVLVQLPYLLVPLAVAWLVFRRKDILT